MFYEGQLVRFKTKEEFIREFGDDFYNRIDRRNDGRMDHLFGVSAEIGKILYHFFRDGVHNLEFINIQTSGNASWIFNSEMIVPCDIEALNEIYKKTPEVPDILFGTQ